MSAQPQLFISVSDGEDCSVPSDDLADRIPPEYQGQTWEQRAPWSESGSIRSRFPPVTIGNPAEPFGPFIDFQTYNGIRLYNQRDPREWCRECRGGLEYPTIKAGIAICQRCRERAPEPSGGRLRL